MVEVKKTKRKGETWWVFSFEVAKKKFNCEHLYKTEASALKAGQNFVKRYVQGA